MVPHGVTVVKVQDPTFGLVEPHPIHLSPAIQPVRIPLQGLRTLRQIDTTCHLGVISKLTEGTLNPHVQVINKEQNLGKQKKQLTFHKRRVEGWSVLHMRELQQLCKKWPLPSSSMFEKQTRLK